MCDVSQENHNGSKPPEGPDSGAEHPRSRRRETPEEPVTAPPAGNGWRREQRGIELSYVLGAQEIYRALRYSSRFRPGSLRFRLLIAACAAAAVLFGAAGISTYRGIGLFYAALCAAAAVLLCVVPRLVDERRARDFADGRTVRATVYQDRVEFDFGGGKKKIPLDGSARYAQTGDLLLLYPPETGDRKRGRAAGRRPLILPARCVVPHLLPEVQAVLISGTRPKRRI